MSVMAGLDPATQCAHVGARWKRASFADATESFDAAQTRGDWVAGSSPAMTDFFLRYLRLAACRNDNCFAVADGEGYSAVFQFQRGVAEDFSAPA